MLIRLPIDTKSLYFNIKNDNASGHTATVATPLKQGNSIHTELAQIIRVPENITPNSRERLISKILSKSRAQARILRTFVFDRIAVNGHELKNIPCFCVYIREETDPNNVHFGRQKVHYPISLEYSDLDIEINNRSVYKQVSDFLREYAFIVEAFEYDESTRILNIDATVVGENNIPYSKVFINRRGVGNKFSNIFSNNSDSYDTEIIALREKLGFENVYPGNFDEVMSGNDNLAGKIVTDYLIKLGASRIRNLKAEYPYALYDLECILGQEKRYVIIKQTATKKKQFSLPITKIQFCNDFRDVASMVLVTDIVGEPKLYVYTIDQMNRMDKAINSITYYDRS